MPIQPVKIPQNVYIEDRIVGPLTLKQIIIVCLGCGLSYALWASATKAAGGNAGIPLTIILWIPGVLSVLFAFVRVNDLSLLRICFLLCERIVKPSVRTLEPRRGITINIRTFSSTDQKQAAPVGATAEAAGQLADISSALDFPVENEAPLPVRPDRIRASAAPKDEAPLDGVGPASTSNDLPPRISLMRDLS